MRNRRILSVLLALCLLLALPATAEEGFTSDAARIDRAAESVVRLLAYDAEGELLASGWGFAAWDGDTLVTCCHILAGAARAEAVAGDGSVHGVTAGLAADRDGDVALLALDGTAPLEPLPLDAEAAPEPGQSVVAIGSAAERQSAVSLGSVSRVYDEGGVRRMQITAPISAAGSGGALMDDAGRVIGVATDGGADGQDLSVAVHISRAVRLREAWDGTRLPLEALFPEEEPAAPEEDPAAEAPADPVAEVFGWMTAGADGADDGEAAGLSGLEFGEGMEAVVDGDVVRLRFDIRNASEQTILGCWVQVSGTDAGGMEIFAHDDGGWWTEAELAPGESGRTETVEVPVDERIAALHTRVLAVAYADGSEWELNAGSPEAAAARDWPWPPAD